MKNNLLFSQFPFWTMQVSEVDKLLDSINFYDETWKPNPAPSQGMWHKYDLPFIGVSDEVNLNDSWFDGRLGIYKALDNEWKKEGRIVLFRKNISVVAKQCAIENKLNPDACFIDIIKIVLLHEIGHWIFHYMPTDFSEKNSLYGYFDTDLHEAIAQNFVKLGIEKDNKLEIIFKWMCKKQDVIYQNDLPGDIVGLSVLRKWIEECHQKSTNGNWKVHFNNVDAKDEPTIIDDVNKNEDSITIEDVRKITPKNCLSSKLPKTLIDYENYLYLKRGEIRARKFGIK